MIIDCHGHYTTAPADNVWRETQMANFKAGGEDPPIRTSPTTRSSRRSRRISCACRRERGADMTLFSPRASTMAHHVGDEAVVQAWTRRATT